MQLPRLLGSADGTVVGDDMWLQTSRPHRRPKDECPLSLSCHLGSTDGLPPLPCLVPLLCLPASTDGSEASDDKWQQLNRLHHRQEGECLMQQSCLLASTDDSAVGDDMWQQKSRLQSSWRCRGPEHP